MARIKNIELPGEKHTCIGLTAIYGIGRNLAKTICENVEVDPAKKIKDLTEEEIAKLRKEIDNYTVEGDLRRDVQMSIKNKMEINCYEGIRHKKGLPVRGQRTSRNAKTRKGRGKVVANKKKVGKQGVNIWHIIEEKEKNDLKVISEKLEVINEQLAMKQKQKRKMLVNTLIVADVCLIILFILLAILESPYQSWDYSDPEWSVIGTLWHSFEWVYFKVAPLMVIVITAILGIIFVKRNK